MKVLVFILFCFPAIALAQPDTTVQLIARNTGEKIMANGDTVRVMGFATSLTAQPNVPGPRLEFYEGDSVYLDLWNVSQGAPHTIHLHGLDVDQANDGVGHLSFEVHHMDHGYYKFKAPHAGTYLYHCHVTSAIHVQGGMYGMIIVHPADGSATTWNGGYPYDVTLPILFSEIDTTWHNDTIIEHEHDTTIAVHPVTLPKYDPQYYLLNGFSDQQITDNNLELVTSVNAVNYLRFANIGFRANRVILPAEMNAQIIDSDGRPFALPELSDTIEIFPGERYGVIGTFPAELVSTISIEYFNMNTGTVENTQLVPVIVSGYLSSDAPLADHTSFTVHPNPSNGNFMLLSDKPFGEEYEIRLYDSNGRICFSSSALQPGTNELSFEIRGLAPGVYLLGVISDGTFLGYEKVVIQD